MRTPVLKRSVMIGKHRTSVSLEQPFWEALREIATDQALTVTTVIETVDSHRAHPNLSSALRLFVLDYYRRAAGAAVDTSAREKPSLQHRDPAGPAQ